uniref:Uncharacterized protein n=1 Tax=Chromera velia CCMP2878 TaxID=1169474 RepID=A0A0G4HZC8_9ALVE|eukprot:Cvel_9664.t1-p1 / transcript=Cvel_9664.t1 / gene=Cvel_9664 / organism=Chromera_velia_CCMP2878 / gene_product=Delta-latroinsectotoxin-Lt1a, putative / transcript_product=Delta-latroinsectotoxin-Lt1a, putative / location=Cvel_scaffold563:3936-4427(-) / protein_length=164 / sequence_SO=supercontig / SO=protein_coding / is_pseudo=false
MLRTAPDAFIAGGKEDDLRLLLFVGADLDGLHDGETALIRAVSAGHMGAVEMLAEAGARLEVKGSLSVGGFSGNLALMVACLSERLEIGRYLLSRGADPNAETENGFRPLHFAGSRGLTAITVSLLTHGAEVNAKAADGDLALHHAVASGQRETTEALVDGGGT